MDDGPLDLGTEPLEMKAACMFLQLLFEDQQLPGHVAEMRLFPQREAKKVATYPAKHQGYVRVEEGLWTDTTRQSMSKPFADMNCSLQCQGLPQKEGLVYEAPLQHQATALQSKKRGGQRRNTFVPLLKSAYKILQAICCIPG